MSTGPGGGSGTGPGGGSGSGPGRDEVVETIADLLRVVALIAADRLADRDPAARVRLTQGLRTAHLALADLRTPAPRDPEAAAPAPAIDWTGPGHAGGPPCPGADFDLPMWPGTAQLAASFARRAD